MKKQAVIFDLDGTLWDSVKEVVEAWNPVLERYGAHLTLEAMAGYMGKTAEEIAASLFPNMPAEKCLSVMKECSGLEHPYLREHGALLFPGVEEMLKELFEKNYFLAIVSNCQDGYIQAFLDYYNFWSYFDDMEMAGRTGMPKGENIRLVMERNHIENAVYMGDTDGDRSAAEAAGVPFIYAEYGFGHVESPQYRIHEIPQLTELVDEIFSR